MSYQPAFKRKTFPTPKLSIDTMAKLETVFVSNNWKIEEMNRMSLYNRFCETLLKFDEGEQQLILDLTKRFKWIKYEEHIPVFEKLVNLVMCDYPDSDIVLAPCLPEDDLGKMKSARMVLYTMQATPYSCDLSRCLIEKDDIAEKSKYIKDNTIVVLADDFVGTGETALGAVNYVRKVLGKDFPNDRIKVLAIAVLKIGKQILNDIGIQVYCEYLFDKGISDYYQGDALTDAKKNMESIESKIGVKKRFHFGYGHSEALVCMTRCPNNTFPVYWLGKNTAPYERMRA